MPDPTPTPTSEPAAPTPAVAAPPTPAVTAAPTSILGGATAPALPPAEPAPTAPPTLVEALFPDGVKPEGKPQGGDPPAEPTVEAKPDDAKPAVEGDPAKPAEPAAPLTAESYADLALPEGLVVDDTLFGEAKAAFAEAGVPPAQAPVLLNLYAKALQQQLDSAQSQTNAILQQWESERKAMPEFQGDREARTLAVLATAIDEFSPDPAALRDYLNVTHLGDNPNLLKTIYAMAASLVEDGPLTVGAPLPAGPNGTSSIRGKSLGQLIYPNGTLPAGDPSTSRMT